MKVLIVFKDSETDNLFVHTLCDKIRQKGIDIECSQEKFWNSETHYDIIHFQWPEEVIGWNCTDISQIEKLKKRIEYLKHKGCKFVYTRHNVCPHYSNKVIGEAYKIIESNSTCVVHMGKYSLDEYQQKYPNSKNAIIQHHIYENTYNENISRQTARSRLDIPLNKFIITAFGKFRNTEERKMMASAFIKLKMKHKYLLVPRFYPFHQDPPHSNLIKRLISYISYHIIIPLCKMVWNINGGSVDDIVSHDELPYYLAASDIIFIQRKHILNSGNVPLAFLFKKVVVGPNVGNVGELLRETGNPTFDPHNNDSIVSAIQEAYLLHQNNHGEKNYQYAIKHMGLDDISEQYIKIYKSIEKDNE